MRKLWKIVGWGYALYLAARVAELRLAFGQWGGTDEHVALAGRTVDPSGIWLRRPFGDEALIVFRGRGSRSPEAERDREAAMVVGVAAAEHREEEAEAWGPLLGTPSVIVSDPKP